MQHGYEMLFLEKNQKSSQNFKNQIWKIHQLPLI